MNESMPTVVSADGVISVYFLDSNVTQSIEVACVVDFTDFRVVVGIEILDWHRQLSGGQIGRPSASGQLRWSYDHEIDALYIHTNDGRGQNQERTTCTVRLDANQRVVTVQVPLPSPVVRSE
jgi:nucleoside diphosphate kinase